MDGDAGLGGMTPIERAAKAARDQYHLIKAFRPITEDEAWISAMRAGLLAIREPSEGMMAAKLGEDGLDTCNDFLDNYGADAVWQAMIDEVTKE